jgi:HEAT repeats
VSNKLPVFPNLEHLKNQAKKILKAYQAGDLEIRERVRATSGTRAFKLADAQFIVARGCGFPSWTALKFHVERAQTQLTPRRKFVWRLAERLVQLARDRDLEGLAVGVSRLPLRDILDVRSRLLETNQHATLVDGLIAGLESQNPRIRYECANVLDHLADERCAEPLTRLLNDPVPRVRRAALHSLSCEACKIAPLPQSVDLVARLIQMALEDESLRVRRTAVDSLAESCADPRAVNALHELEARETDLALLRRVRRAFEHQGS